MRLTYVVFALLGLSRGSNFIHMKWAAELITPAQITLLRLFFGFLPLAFLAWRKGVINRAAAARPCRASQNYQILICRAAIPH